MKLWTTAEYDRLSWQELTQIANGCGPQNCKLCNKFLDNALGLCVFEACAQHDVDYSIGGTKRDKRESDIRFVCNLLVIALHHRSMINIVRVPYLFFYYVAVSYGGNAHFHWRDDIDIDNSNG